MQYGYMARVSFQDLYAEGKISNCNGNNDSPYFACALPKSPLQPASVLDFIHVPALMPGQSEQLHTCIHLDTSEAIILVGKTPPKVDYFSFTVFNVTAHADAPPSILTDSALNGELLRNKPVEVIMEPGQRRMLFCGMGDPLNLLKIKTIPDESSEAPFDCEFALVYTSNECVFEEVKQGLKSAGIPEEKINLLVVPQDIVNVGVARESNSFSFALRISNNTSQELVDYLACPPIQVMRYCSANKNNQPLPIPVLTPRGNGQTELSYWRQVQQLRQSILDAHQADYMAIELTTDIWLNESYIAMQQGVDNLGESRDTPYFSTETFTLPDGSFIVAYGVNHFASGKALYSNLVVYGAPLENGVISVSNKEFTGSAELYLGDTSAPDLYAWRLGFASSEPIGAENYTTIPSVAPGETNGKPNRPPYVLKRSDPLYLSFRAYVEKATTVGAAWHELVLDRVIVFVPREPAATQQR